MPRATIGNSKRNLGLQTIEGAPQPTQYLGHVQMTERRSVSAERNAPRATIGNRNMADNRAEPMTPGPHTYDTLSARKKIGDAASVKVPFTTQVRPISAKTGQVRLVRSPGPQDYATISTNTYRRR